MRSNKCGLSVMVDGRVVEEFQNGEAVVPFGAEYTLLLTNEHDRHGVFKIFIDGEEMSKGGYIVPSHQSRQLERGSHSPKRFKFVALDSTDAQDHGKDQQNREKKMGVIEARFYLEKKRPEPVKEVHHHHHHPYPVPTPWWGGRRRPWRDDQIGLCRKSRTCSDGAESLKRAVSDHDSGDTTTDFDPGELGVTYTAFNAEATKGGTVGLASFGGQHTNSTPRAVREGATVEGGHSNQQFGKQWVDIEDDYTTLRIVLKGFDPAAEAEVVAEAVEVPAGTRPVAAAGVRHCDECGAKALRDESKFCHACGTKLV